MILDIPGAPEVAQRLQATVGEKLQDLREKQAGLDALSRQSWERRPPGISISRYLQFQILHRQFYGGGFPGLPIFVGTARRILQWARRK